MPTPNVLPDIEDAARIDRLHDAACAAQRATYTDPSTGYVVFTAVHLRTRRCCGCGCRHCPYPPASGSGCAGMLAGALEDLPDEVDVLFWSGGKDSFLALQRLRKERTRAVLLVTTYGGSDGIVAHQEVEIAVIAKQATALGLPLLGIPLVGTGHGGGYVRRVIEGLNIVRGEGVRIVRVAFGDLHLRHVREWREGEMVGIGELYFPLWGVKYAALLSELESADVRIEVCAVDSQSGAAEIVKVGDVFGRDLISRLPKDVDSFGENGEFHTLVRVWENTAGKNRKDSTSW